MRAHKTLALLATACFLAACGAPTRTSDRDLQPIDTARLKSLVDEGRGATVLVDVRTSEQFAGGHLPGAVNIPLPQMIAGDPRLTSARNIIVYGGGWQDILGPAGAKKLIALGYQNVFDYRGGMELWQDDGGEVAPPR